MLAGEFLTREKKLAIKWNVAMKILVIKWI